MDARYSAVAASYGSNLVDAGSSDNCISCSRRVWVDDGSSHYLYFVLLNCAWCDWSAERSSCASTKKTRQNAKEQSAAFPYRCIGNVIYTCVPIMSLLSIRILPT